MHRVLIGMMAFYHGGSVDVKKLVHPPVSRMTLRENHSTSLFVRGETTRRVCSREGFTPPGVAQPVNPCTITICRLSTVDPV